MPRYHVVHNTHGSGGFDEFTAPDDDDAIDYAHRRLMSDERIVSLSEVVIGPTDRHRPIAFNRTPDPDRGPITTVGRLVESLRGFPPDTSVAIAHHGMDGREITVHQEDGYVRLSDDGDC